MVGLVRLAIIYMFKYSSFNVTKDIPILNMTQFTSLHRLPIIRQLLGSCNARILQPSTLPIRGKEIYYLKDLKFH
jgi:hypothetical protein